MSEVKDDPGTFTTSSLPSDPRLMTTVANGYLGTKVFGDVLHVNGVYNGDVGDCHRADIPSPLNVRLCVSREEEIIQSFSLNTKTGTFSHVIQCSSCTATQQIFAHRSHSHLLVNIITLRRTHESSDPVKVDLENLFKMESSDLELHRGHDFHEAQYIFGSTLIPEVKSCPLKSVHMIWSPVPQSLMLQTSELEKSWVFVTAVSETEDDVKEKFIEGLTLVDEGQIYSSHEKAWAEFWTESCIEVEGSLALTQALYGCLYYLLSSLPPLGSSEEFHGISPGGLSNGHRREDYWGHIFWDQDTWMYPNILLFYPEMARQILKYRIRTLGGAVQNAQEQGYKDTDFFAKAGGWEVVSSVAEYWCSRVVWSVEEDCYHLKGVMPPDEYHSDVDNCVYTNAMTKTR
ncbi:hypothetical protein FKM82_003137 [Ascaphus truei]